MHGLGNDFVVLDARTGPDGRPTFNFWSAAALERFKGAAGVAAVTLEMTPPQLRAILAEERPRLRLIWVMLRS